MLKIAYHPTYAHPLPANHRFPMLKYELLPEQLEYERTVKKSNFFSPKALKPEQILKVHDQEYWRRLSNLEISLKEQRASGFPHSRQLIDREVTIMGGTLECAQYALQNGVAMNIAGGTHHAFTNKGEGFCLLNDIALATNYLLEKEGLEKILIVDLDVHQGNGTAEIFANDDRVFTFSMHGEHNYPLRKEKSSLDIPLPDHMTDRPYLELLDNALKETADTFEPGFIFFQSGVDILESDKLGRLSITQEGCKTRDRLVLEYAHRNHIPLVASMGGGYSQDIRIIVDAHANTFRLAQEIFF